MSDPQNRSMDSTLRSVESLTLGLFEWLSDIDSDGSGRGQDPSDRSRLLGRMIDQLLTMSTLIELSLRQRRELGDPTTAWILLEQARQQLGWAALTAGALKGTVSERVGIVPEQDDDAELALEESPAVATVLEFLIQRDLIPQPEYAGELLDMGVGLGVIPDPRPVTPLELVPLQMLSAAAMQRGSVVSGARPRPVVDRMAYDTYVSTLLDEAADLLGERSCATGDRQLDQLAEIGRDAVITMRQLTSNPLEVFPPREGGTTAT